MTDSSIRRPRIYLAGPEVFLPDAMAAGRRKQTLCETHGFAGIFPLDAALDLSGLAKADAARRISLANEGLMRSCDLLIANLSPFRGVSMDAGTAFEVGFMRALGRPLLGYTNTPLDLRRRTEMARAAPSLPFDCDTPTAAVEDFELAENLMIEIAIVESGGTVVRSATAPGDEMIDLAGFEACLTHAEALMGRR
jgi:nucleoside 2-deoxyribosyltransferase